MKDRSFYVGYFRIGETAYREKVRFVEENSAELRWLPFEERIEIEIDYVLCLFEMGRYERYLQKVDVLLETVISENIFTVKGMDVFQELLFRKAACLYQIKKREECRCILQQLLRMSPNQSLYLGLYILCDRHRNSDVSQTIRAGAMAALLLVVAITAVQILLIAPFFDPYLAFFVQLRNVLFAVGLGTLLGLEMAFQRRIYKETGLFVYGFVNKVFNRGT
jgi:tetratricopeptide (TPR) repeat protein